MILSAERAFSRDLVRPSRPVQRAGLAFERKFLAALRESAPLRCTGLEHNPWFRYFDQDSPTPTRAPKVCCPDIMLPDPELGVVIVFEVKLTWTPEAHSQLKLYIPVVESALHCPARGVVVAKFLTPDAPKPQPNLLACVETPTPGLYHWSVGGPIQW